MWLKILSKLAGGPVVYGHSISYSCFAQLLIYMQLFLIETYLAENNQKVSRFTLNSAFALLRHQK